MLRLSTNKTFWHKAKNGHTFLDISDCVSPTSSLTSTARGVTHHAEANMPIVRATSRVCKFHTCPIILPPTLPPSALPFCAFSPLTHAPPPSLLTHTSHWTAWGAESGAASLRTCNRNQRSQQRVIGPDNTEGLSRSCSLPYKQVSWDSQPLLSWLDAWRLVSKLFAQQKVAWMEGWDEQHVLNLRCNIFKCIIV